MAIRSAYGEKRRVGVVAKSGRAKQSMRDECNINLILAKYQRTGAISHFAKFRGRYDFAPAIEYRDAIDLMREADSMFQALPSSLRKEFSNDAAEFLSFVQDPANRERMADLGLLSEEAAAKFRASKTSSSGAPVGADLGDGSEPAPG